MELYKFEWDFGKEGQVLGLFLATPIQVIEAKGREIYLGNVLGEHSEIYGVIQEDHIELLSSNDDFINQAVQCGAVPFGYNPLEYLD